jgi:hypothetical protein
MSNIFVILSWIVMATLALAIARQLSEQVIVYHPSLLENFYNKGQSQGQGQDPVNNTLLADVLQEKRKNVLSDSLTAKSCYDVDFMSHTQLSGDYTQRTNNFKHGNPDNCSAPLTEFVNSIYA